ncbi:DUF4893 domain-containing protein [Sphingomonas sp.]|uniref:DUF4893 domain-containing protein n=1 Tax=Sphingomonas sp. TaxID=28214 RepID=UPI0035AE63A8
MRAVLGAALLMIAGGAVAADRADWRRVATKADRARLRRWHDAWVEAMAQVRASEHVGAAVALGALADGDRALADPNLPDGDYRCRTIKLGAKGLTQLRYVAYPFFRCRVSEGGSRLVKLDGSQRIAGRLYADTDARAVFLGTLMLADETRPLAYGRDRARDVVGIVERVAPERWRIAMPYPAYESLLDVMEIVPAG